MPKKLNKRKTIQAAKRKALTVELARKNKRWPGTRREGLIAHHNGTSAAMLTLLLGSGVARAMMDRDEDDDE